MLWLTPAVFWMDYNEGQLYDGAVVVGLGSRGAITLADLANMDFDRYKQVMKSCEDVVKKLYGKEKDDG